MRDTLQVRLTIPRSELPAREESRNNRGRHPQTKLVRGVFTQAWTPCVQEATFAHVLLKAENDLPSKALIHVSTLPFHLRSATRVVSARLDVKPLALLCQTHSSRPPSLVFSSKSIQGSHRGI
jgi:hypothetical protein